MGGSLGTIRSGRMTCQMIAHPPFSAPLVLLDQIPKEGTPRHRPGSASRVDPRAPRVPLGNLRWVDRALRGPLTGFWIIAWSEVNPWLSLIFNPPPSDLPTVPSPKMPALAFIPPAPVPPMVREADFSGRVAPRKRKAGKPWAQELSDSRAAAIQ